MYSVKNLAEYIVALIAAFARHFSMCESDAYQYQHRYGAVKVVHGICGLFGEYGAEKR